MKRKIFTLFLLLVFLFPINIFALSKDYEDKISSIVDKKVEEGKINFYLFRGEGCPHCAEEEKWIKKIKKEYKKYVNFYDFEVWYDKDNQEKLKQVGKVFDLEIKGVPFTVIGDKHYSGFSETLASSMEEDIKGYLGNSIKKEDKKVKIPLLGKVSMKNLE